MIRRLYFRLRNIYTNEATLPLSTRMQFGEEAESLARKREDIERWMQETGVGLPAAERLKEPLGG